MSQEPTDPFSEKEESTQKDKFVNALAYVPFLNIFLLYTGDEKQLADAKYRNQGITLFIIWIAVGIVLSVLGLWKTGFIFFLFYIMFAGYCAVKAHNDDYAYFEPLENIIKAFVKDSKNTQKKPDKTSEEDPLGSFKK